MDCRTSEATETCFKPFIFDGFVSLSGKAEDQRPVRILRDTACSQSLILSGVLPLSVQSDVCAVVRGIEMGCVPAPLRQIYVKSGIMTGFFTVGVRSCFPIDGIDLIMGNDIAGGKVYPVPEIVDFPIADADELATNHPRVFVASVLIRAQANKQAHEVDLTDSLFASVLSGSEVPSEGAEGCFGERPLKVAESVSGSAEPLSLTREALIKAQISDLSLTKCLAAAVTRSECDQKHPFFVEDGVLMPRWNSQSGGVEVEAYHDWGVVYQVVIPVNCRQQVLSLAHEHIWSGHLGITKTYHRVLKHFSWPGLKADVVHFCRTCSTCQIVGKPNQPVPCAPLQPIPAVGEPFERVLVDCVGPLPKSKSGNQFLLTMMCVSTRFPEAIPLRTITAPAVTKALVKFFTTYGLPKSLQKDQGTNFLSRVFKETLQTLGILHSVSSAYHPESQGALERWHQTLKSMLKKYCRLPAAPCLGRTQKFELR